jgi:sugar phosphate isomerase/epimerase
MSDVPMGIRIGTMVRGDRDCVGFIASIQHFGFESYQIYFWETLGGTDLNGLAERLLPALAELSGGKPPVISALAVFTNPMAGGEKGAAAVESWKSAIRTARLFGTDIVSGFTGRISGSSIEESLPLFGTIFGELAAIARDEGVRLAFENCPMNGNWHSGDWNIAHNPAAWELMFNEVPRDNIGLEWEPAHQIMQLIDPLPQLRKWVGKVFHVHGKDASVYRDRLAEYGIIGRDFFAEQRNPGFGDTDWRRVCTELSRAGYRGSIDIEGHHDPVFRKELELTGQLRALEYLKACRGGGFAGKHQA